MVANILLTLITIAQKKKQAHLDVSYNLDGSIAFATLW